MYLSHGTHSMCLASHNSRMEKNWHSLYCQLLMETQIWIIYLNMKFKNTDFFKAILEIGSSNINQLSFVSVKNFIVLFQGASSCFLWCSSIYIGDIFISHRFLIHKKFKASNDTIVIEKQGILGILNTVLRRFRSQVNGNQS